MAGQQTYFLLILDVKVLFRTQPLHFFSDFHQQRRRNIYLKNPKQDCNWIWVDMAFVQRKHHPIMSGSIVRYLGLVVMMLRPRNHVWTRGHHLMKTLLEAKLLFMRQFLCIIYTHTHTHTHTHIYIYINTHTSIYLSINKYIYIYTNIYSFTYIYTYIDIYIYIHAYAYIFIYMHLYIQIHIHVSINIWALIYIYMKMNGDQKTQGLQRMLLFIELLAFVKHFPFYTFVRACNLLNETKRCESFQNILFLLVRLLPKSNKSLI